jgi:hypothetical protein
MPDAKRRLCARRPTRVAVPLVAVALVGLAAVSVPGTLQAGSGAGNLKGRIAGWEKLLPAVYAEAAKPDAHRYTWREPSPTVKQDFRRLSANVTRDVCVAALAGGPASAHEPQAVKLAGGRLTPSTIVVSPGSRLSIKNADPFPHELYEVSNPAWAPNPTAPGSTREWAASTPGTHQIRDQLFPGIVMYVVVDERAVDFAFPDREGGFSLSVPPGDYTLRAFFDGKPVGKGVEGIHVTERGYDMKEPMAVGGESK